MELVEVSAGVVTTKPTTKCARCNKLTDEVRNFKTSRMRRKILVCYECDIALNEQLNRK